MKAARNERSTHVRATRPATKSAGKTAVTVTVIVIAALLVAWVWNMSVKAQQTVQVAMLATDVYKNQVITADCFVPYDMLMGEFEKFSVVEENGEAKRRVLLYTEVEKVVNSFAAYPLKANTYAEYRDFVKTRVNNSDSVMYTFPGKQIVPLEISGSELQAFKTFIMPGDRLTITSVYTEETKVASEEEMGSGQDSEKVFRSEAVFEDIIIADLLNQQGESVLDIYAYYNELSVWEQASLDASQSFTDSVEPKTLLVALTPDEVDRYYYYLSKPDVEFKVSMPQRVE